MEPLNVNNLSPKRGKPTGTFLIAIFVRLGRRIIFVPNNMLLCLSLGRKRLWIIHAVADGDLFGASWPVIFTTITYYRMRDPRADLFGGGGLEVGDRRGFSQYSHLMFRLDAKAPLLIITKLNVGSTSAD